MPVGQLAHGKRWSSDSPSLPGLWDAPTPSSSLAPEGGVETQIKGGEEQDNPNICQEPSPTIVPEEQEVETDHDAHKPKDVDHNNEVSFHGCILKRLQAHPCR